MDQKRKSVVVNALPCVRKLSGGMAGLQINSMFEAENKPHLAGGAYFLLVSLEALEAFHMK